MTEESRKIQIPVEVDATGAKAGFEEVKQGGRDMAQAMQQSAQQAGQALEGGMVASVKKTTEAMAQAKMSWREFLGANMGPAMKQFAADGASNAEAHTKAIRQIAEQWKEYKATGQAALSAVATQSAGAAAATEKLNLTQQRLLDSLSKQATIAGQGKAAWLEMRAAQLGVADQAAVYITRLRQAEQAQAGVGGAIKKTAIEFDKYGLSVKQTSAAMRQVPAQFTDIITSLQGGQAPLTVLLQQGGQLKDVFGGVAPAFKALSSYIIGLINPFTLAAAAIGVTAYALNAGGKELREFQNAATISGNAIGQNVSQFNALRDSLVGIAGTKGKAAEALTEIASSGKLAGSNITGIAEAAILMEKATGQAIDKTVAEFAKLAESPVSASLELNKQYNFLTAAIYSQIKALDEQGKAVQAAELAEKAFSDTLKGRATTVIQNVGLMEKAWRGLTSTAKGAWDAMLNVGREDSLGDKLAKVSAEIDKGRQSFDPSAFGGNAEARAKLKSNLQLQASLQEQVRMEKRGGEAAAEANRVRERTLQATVAFDKLKEQSLTKQQKLEKEIAQAERDGLDAGKSRVEIEKVIAGIRERNKESGAAGTGQSEVAAIRAKIKEQTDYLARLKAQAADPESLKNPVKLTDGEKQVLKIQEELKTSISGVARAQKEKALIEAQSLAGLDKLVAAQERQNKGLLEAVTAYDKLVESTGKQADSILQQALGQEAANASFGKGKTALEEMTLAQLKNSLAEAEASDRFAPAYIAALTAKTEAQQRYVEALQQTEFKQASLKLTEAGRVAADETQLLQLELSLVGQTREVRERIIGQRKAELVLAKEIADIDKLNLGSGPDADLRREELKAKARANFTVEANNAAAKSVADEWQRTADSINTSITEALLRGFESGKGFAANLRDTVVNMFKTMVLRPVVNAVVNTGTQAIGSALGLNQSGGGLGSFNPILSAGNSLLGGNVLGSGSVLGSALGLSSITPGALAGANAIGAVAGGDAIGALAASQGWIAAGEGTALAAGSGAAAAGTAGGLSAGLAAIPGWGWAAIGAGVLLGLGGSNMKSTSNTGNAASTFDQYGNQTGYSTFYGGSSAATDAQINALQAEYQAQAKALGIGTVASYFNVGGNTGKNGESPNFALGGGAGGLNFQQAETPLTEAALQLAASRAVFAALKGSNLPTYLAGIFDSLDINTVSQDQITSILATAQAFKGLHEQLQLLPFENLKDLTYAAASSLVTFSGGIEKFTTNLGTYYENFYSAQEKAANSTKQIFKTLGAAGIDVTALYDPSIESFRALVDAQDITTASGREAYAALLSVSGAFATLVSASSDVSVATENLRNALGTSIVKLKELSSAIYSAAEANSPGINRSAAQAQIAAALAIAKASGVLPSLDTLAPALKALSAPSQDLFKTFVDYQRDQALTASDLNALGGLADTQITVQQAQLDALNKVNASVLSVADAVAALAAAEYARGTAILAAGAEGQGSRAIPGFANGGDHMGGARIVGERGPEIELTGPSRIINTENIMAALRNPQTASEELVIEIRSLRQEVANLRASSEATASNTRKSADTLQRVTRDGNAMLTEAA